MYSGLGTALNQSYQGLGNATYGADTSIGNANANAALGNLNASANIMNLGMNAGGALLGFLSDARAKEDIEPVGELDDGQTIYRYRYAGDPRTQIGLIAQEVEQTNPDAVIDDFVGDLKGVDYAKATDFAATIARFRPRTERAHSSFADSLLKIAA
jgi:Chaperone of endosialidase